jgi:hypothetical protein
MTALARVFKSSSFCVKLLQNLSTKSEIRTAVQTWVKELQRSGLKPRDRIVVGYAGHGYLVQGKAVMIPCEMDPQAILSEDDILDQGYALNLLLSNVREAAGRDRLVVVLYDACQTAKRADQESGHGAPAVRFVAV